MENVVVEPVKKHNVKDMLFLMFFGIVFLAILEMISPHLKPSLRHKVPFEDGFFWGMSVACIVYCLSRKIYQAIKIDYASCELVVEYISIFKGKCESKIHFDVLKFEYRETASRAGLSWVLMVKKENRKVLSLRAGEYGFKKEKLDYLVVKLKELKANGYPSMEIVSD